MAHNNLGALLLEKQEYQRAIPHLQAAAQLDPRAAEPRINLALTLLQEGKFDEAIHSGLEAVSLQPNRADAYNLLGNTFWKRGDAVQAARYFHEAIQRKPGLVQPYYSLGMLYLQEAATLGDVQPRQAIVYLEKALTLQPNSLQMLSTLARVLAPHPDAAVRDGQRAVELAEAACQQTQFHDPALLDVRAAAYAEVGRFAEAIATARQAMTQVHLTQDENLAQQIAERIQLYQAQKPYRNSPARNSR